ncbi:MAG: hypothetical protein A2782_00105 [Candidatus Blackburnbacteria bacterium RIFCSPHIGHO2_01_FULL_43_15b]|uniref:Uncharacterized protein n=1 Tax=Candidatus Blackburnbacteria bacterium RIFCSPHIGHO2_01_FULL_43_15b TaxID=1797513 RepID=A0A1G1V161_9BACT|nr:MAG: hypothetical protein A2782_00105 [Candidatus Blackburnbacteria bacterium RIFCSPHIGHO2_01_FULL_43_15b]
MKKNKLICICFVIAILVITSIVIYNKQFRWVSHQDEVKNFSINYPATWSHDKDKSRNLADRWYFERKREGAGRFRGDELVLTDILEYPGFSGVGYPVWSP